MAVVSGDPSKAELFQVQLSLPDGYKIPPHFHPTDEVIEVKEGVFLVGMGDTFDLKKTNAMKRARRGRCGQTCTTSAAHRARPSWQ